MSKNNNIFPKKYPCYCVWCEKDFLGTKVWTKYCSEKCRRNAWYKRQPKKYKDKLAKINTNNQRNKKHRYKRKALNMLGGACSKCGYNKCIAALDFHHLGDKDATIKELMHLSWKRIEAEVKKCIILCANCHREEHFNEHQA